MAELDPDVILNALRNEARQKKLAQRLAVPEFEADQLRVDKKVMETEGILSGLKIPDKAAQIEMNRAVVKRLDDVARVAGNPFGAGDILEAKMNNLMGGKTFEEEREASRAATAGAAERLGPIGSKVAEVGGEVMTSIATAPMTTSIKGAMLAGGGISLAADTAEKLFKEDRAPTLEEAMVSGLLGTGLGGLGQLMGNKLTRWFTQKGAAKTPMTIGSVKQLRRVTRDLSRAFQFADDSDAVVDGSVLLGFSAGLKTNRKFVEQGLDPNIDKGAWNGLNVLGAHAGRLQPGEGLTLRELASARTSMRDVAARGEPSSTNLIFDMDRAFSKAVMTELKRQKGNSKAVLAWQMLDKLELQKIQGEFLTKIVDKAELESASGAGPVDVFLQQEFKKLVTGDAGRKLMVKLGFTPEQKELFREAAHGTNATVLANRLGRVMGSTWMAPFYRLTFQPILRSRGSSEASTNIMETLGMATDIHPSQIIPATTSGAGQVTAPITPQIAPPLQQQMLPQPPAQQQTIAPQQTGPGPQRMPRPFTPQSQSAVPTLPKP